MNQLRIDELIVLGICRVYERSFIKTVLFKQWIHKDTTLPTCTCIISFSFENHSTVYEDGNLHTSCVAPRVDYCRYNVDDPFPIKTKSSQCRRECKHRFSIAGRPSVTSATLWTSPCWLFSIPGCIPKERLHTSLWVLQLDSNFLLLVYLHEKYYK